MYLIRGMKGKTQILWLLVMLPWLSGCYKFVGYSIDPEVKTFYVGNFKLTATIARATINQTFEESLKDKVSR